MTIGTNTARVSFNTDGATAVFPVSIQAYQASDFKVVLTNSATGVVSQLVLNSDYTLASSGTLTPPAWSLTTESSQFASPFAAGSVLQVILNPVEVQQTQYSQGQAFPSGNVQQNMDRLTQMVIRQSDILSRAVVAPDGDVSPLMTLPSAQSRALMYAAYDANGNAIAVAALPGPQLTQGIFNSFLGSVTFVGGPTDASGDAYFHRTTAYAGGTPGFVNTALTVQTDVNGVAGTSNEWPLLALLNNHANGGASENTAAYSQGNKYGTAPTWGHVIELIERNHVNNPPFGSTALEVDMSVNGTDGGVGNRVGVDLVIRRFDMSGGAPAAQANWGYRIDTTDPGANVGFGYGFFPGSTALIGFDTSQGTMNIAALQIAQAQPIIFDGPVTQLNKLTYQGLGLDYLVNNVLVNRLLKTGGLQVGASQVIGARINGYGVPTGGARQPSFAAGAITLPNLAACVAQLIVDWETHGALGA